MTDDRRQNEYSEPSSVLYHLSSGVSMYEPRKYRNLVDVPTLEPYRVVVKQTDLMVYTQMKMIDETKELILEHRGYVENFIQLHPEFSTTLAPWTDPGPAPAIIVEMVKASRNADVGPMAAIAGAIAGQVGFGLLNSTEEVIVENGGDVFVKINPPVTVGIYAGTSPLSLQIGLKLKTDVKPLAVCTSSGTIGHSFSMGKADAVCVVAESCAIADAAATSIGNRIDSPADIEGAIKAGRQIKDIIGILVIIGDKMGMWGGSGGGTAKKRIINVWL